MKEYKFIIPDTSDIEVGDVVEIEGVRHKLTNNGTCLDCSLYAECVPPYLCGDTQGAAFKIEEPRKNTQSEKSLKTQKTSFLLRG